MDADLVMKLLIDYWRAVRDTFHDAWGVAPSKSRLMHGAGIKAMGTLMDAMVPRHDPRDLSGLGTTYTPDLKRSAILAQRYRLHCDIAESLTPLWPRIEALAAEMPS